MGKRFYILSIDGGGLKGLIAIKIMKVIEKLAGISLSEKCGLMAGTSTGGLIVSALSVPDSRGMPQYDLTHIENLYAEVGMTAFKQGELSLTGNETEKFQKILRKTFDARRISETLKPILVPTYDVQAKRIVAFKTRSALQNSRKNVLLTDVCRATSAIPPVFPTHVIDYNGKKLHCMDAGWHLKNPALSALAEVIKHKEYYGVGDEGDISLLSISTGSHRDGDVHWTTDVESILHSQHHDMHYIKSQKLDIDFKKLRFMRVDLQLGGAAFAFAQLFTWLEKIHSLSLNRKFIKDIKYVLE